MRQVLFMVKRHFFQAVIAGTKTWEFRRPTPRWQTVFDSNPEVAVFQCGQSIHRREIIGCTTFGSAEHALGHPATSDEFAMLGYGKVLGFKLGREVRI
jgi:hypothetical protein